VKIQKTYSLLHDDGCWNDCFVITLPLISSNISSVSISKSTKVKQVNQLALIKNNTPISLVQQDCWTAKVKGT